MWKPIRLLFAPGGTDGNGAGDGASTTPAKTSTTPQNSLATVGISDSLEHLDIPDALKASVKKAEGTSPQPSPQGGAGEEAAKLAERAKTAGRTAEEQTAFEKAEAAKSGDTTKPDFNQDQQAWLDLRAKATTPEEIAELEKDIPEFSTEQADWINAQADAAEAGDQKTDDADQAPEFTAEQKPYVEGLTAKLTEAEAKVTELESKRVELEAEVQQAKNASPAVAGNVHPMALVDTADQIDAYEENLEKFVAWGRQNWDGSEEVAAQGDKPGQRAYTAKEIREAVTRRESELRKVIPAARQALQARTAESGEAKKQYPALFDAKAPENKIVAAVVKQWPVLKTMPNHLTVIGDSIAGEELRQFVYSDKVTADAAKGILKIFPRLGQLLPRLADLASGKVKAPKAAAVTRPQFRIKAPVRAGAGAPAARVAGQGGAKKVPTGKEFQDAKEKAPDEMTALTSMMEKF